ncbi:UDP-N-acetylmuramoyl-tripeptide--D-alanyl-D-alanine ligase [Catenuloplanes nepalensis]|uniref:UDP-N-acetylmuramoyl-tripeptide--D-alanyl-D-alanine ligase n=1 Tax=Catenuloplanes nepalensis TaxID=587533 RepID=A0ABT9MKN2_9ACTN|nr:UDP-N-acetylmuramoyl-tripeptide--D-alanyl-D-alanine ligase [Catenuloplanes nepalensis]MDP9791968.1 UDP-N-acetylmuramoyl-tripeptide--D-alanyl-D-alanine ligase [Catenuloplanes nepalensis]
MIPLTLAEIAEAVDGRLVHADPAAQVTGPAEYDSREIVAGGLFVAFPGEHVDGHDYGARAVAAGAAAVLATRDMGPDVPAILVDDAQDALGPLARLVGRRLIEAGLTVVGLTGSSGKTTTKDMVAQLAASLGPTVATAGSLNNELGFPVTALRATGETRFLVLEMGASGLGHIRYLNEIVQPRIGVVLNVSMSHLGGYESVDGIAQAKGEMVEDLPAGGVAVLNADDERVAAMASRTKARVVFFGESAEADVRAEDVTLDARGRPSFTLCTPDGRFPVALGLTGRHMVSNSLAAAAVARELGLTGAALAEALGGMRTVSTRRMDVFDRADGVTVIDDSYNANPSSTAAALRALATLAGDGRRRAIAVLGQMRELGEHSRDAHAEVGRLAAELGVDRLLVVDPEAAPIADGARSEQMWKGESVLLADQSAAIATLRDDLRPGDVVLVKASRYRTWKVADALRAAEADGVPLTRGTALRAAEADGVPLTAGDADA